MLHLTVMIGTEGLDTLEMEKVDSSLPVTWLMSEIMRQMDERYHVIGLEDKKGEPIAYVHHPCRRARHHPCPSNSSIAARAYIIQSILES